MKWYLFAIWLLASQVWAEDARPQNDWSRIAVVGKGPPESIGGYSNGCLLGAEELPERGEGFESIRRFRKRYFGHPTLIRVIKALGLENQKLGRPNLLVGDMSQIRGGPMPYGHRSHQIGLDADFWFSHVPETKRKQDENFTLLVEHKKERVNPKNWDQNWVHLLKKAATHPDVARVFVNWMIKKHLCKITKIDRDWLRKIRPWWGHDRHFHVRLHCQSQSPDCRNQRDLSKVSPCGGEDWFSDAQVIARQKAAEKEGKKPKKKKRKTLPKRCRQLVSEPP